MNKENNAKSEPPFGLINCDKPIGMTSRDLVNIVARQFRETHHVGASGGSSRYRLKIGHCGTLDPLAEGVLVLAVGQASRLVPYVQQQAKHYHATFLLGQTSPTGDLEGDLVHHEVPFPSLEQLRNASETLVGDIEQIPPAYSAVKVDGRRAYDRVRQGEQFDMPSRRVRIDRLNVERLAGAEFDIDVVCGSGTYIRTLGMDLARAAGTLAVMKSLRRYRIGVFDQRGAVTVDQIRASDPRQWLINPLSAVAEMARFDIDRGDAACLANGLSIPCQDQQLAGAEAAAVYQENLVAIVRQRQSRWWPHRVFRRQF